MKKFKFYQDIKISGWQRQTFTIEAETEEEANKIAKQYTKTDVSSNMDVDDVEYLSETEEYVLEDGKPIIELFNDNGETIHNDFD